MPYLQPAILKTERLVLRWLDEGDAQAQFAIYSDPEVMRFINDPWTSMRQAEEAVAAELARYRDGSGATFAIVLRETGQLVGNANLHRFFEMNRRCEVGYALARAQQGRGYATEALAALIGYAFRTFDLNRIEADIDPRNTGSSRLLQRLGFKEEGLLRERWIIRGEKQDSAFYGLLRSDWDSRSINTTNEK